MSRVALPVPHAVIDNIGDVHFDADNWRGISLFTTTQAEAYADARVREALEEAAKICWEMQSAPEFGKDDKDHWLAIAERRIHALIPPTE